jgi:cyclic pyranopterin phosphate synthase
MVKAVDKGMRLEQIRLVSKSGGKSGAWTESTSAESKK